MKKPSVEKQKTHKEDTRYEKKLDTLERENRKLKNENKTLHEALRKTDEYIFSLVKDKTVTELVQQAKESNEPMKDPCPNCKTAALRKAKLGDMVIIACNNCTYRNREHAGNKPA